MAMSLQDRIDATDALQETERVEGILLWGGVDLYQLHETENRGTSDTYFVSLANHRLEAFHKPFHGISEGTAWHYGQDPDNVPLNEVAAWRVARSLGGLVAEIVAPCVLRSHNGESGSLAARAFGFPLTMEPFRVALDQCDAAAFFDSLIGQQDRHLRNYRWDNQTYRLKLIDHGFAFATPGMREHSFSFIDHRCDERDPALTDWERAALEFLLASPDMFGIPQMLTEPQVDALVDRARRMLESNQILRRGFAA